MLFLLLACAHKPVADTSGRPRPTIPKSEVIGVLPVVRVQDLPAPPLAPLPPPGPIEQGLEDAHLPDPTVLDPVKDAAFLRNDYIGNVLFGGGRVRQGDVALEVRARLMEFSNQDLYSDQATRWLTGAVSTALEDARYDWKPLTVTTPPALERVPYRGRHPDDGRDNVNLPRENLRPLPWPEAPAGLVLVPYLRSYYSHNGGWHNGHEWGTLGGARVEVVLVLFDDGRPAWWMEATGRYISGLAQPSRADLDQFLLFCEGQVEEQFKRQLFR